jgi:hypothetical protein
VEGLTLARRHLASVLSVLNKAVVQDASVLDGGAVLAVDVR